MHYVEPMSNLDDALERSRQMIQEALKEARVELASVEARRDELLASISAAEAILGGEPPAPPSAPVPDASAGLTLHEALVRVLEDAGNEWMTARELADD